MLFKTDKSAERKSREFSDVDMDAPSGVLSASQPAPFSRTCPPLNTRVRASPLRFYWVGGMLRKKFGGRPAAFRSRILLTGKNGAAKLVTGLARRGELLRLHACFEKNHVQAMDNEIFFNSRG
jgi:hypothetical protein